MKGTRAAITPRPETCQSTSIISPSVAKLCRMRPSNPPHTQAWLSEMSGILLVSLIAGLGVLLASVALAMPGAQKARDSAPRWESGVSAQEVSLRDRINRPFQAIADRSNRQHRLNGGLTLAEHLARADLKLRTSEFVMIQVGLLVLGAALSLWRFGFGAQFVIAGVAAYLIPMRYVRYRQGRGLRGFKRRPPDTPRL